MKRLPLTHLLIIIAGLIALAAVSWFYTNANDPVEGIPVVEEQATNDGHAVPPVSEMTEEACKAQGGTWNECASACPPGAEVCTQVCVQKCEDLPDWSVDLYFPNSELDTGYLNCDTVFPIKRVAVPEAGGKDLNKAALRELLAGPTEAEKKAGYFSSLPEGVKILSYEFMPAGEILELRFSEELDRGVAGSCRVESIRAQITKTLEGLWKHSMPNLKILIVSGNKSPEETLQP